jgi:hypothetical protein
VSRDRKRRQTNGQRRRRRKQDNRSQFPKDTESLWIRELGLLPSAGLIIDHSVAAHLDLAGLGLVQLGERADPNEPLPQLGHLAADISDPYAISINCDAHETDIGRPIMQAGFIDPHPDAWLSQLVAQQHVLLTVSDCAQVLAARTPSAAAAAFTDTWMGIIGLIAYGYPTGVGYFPPAQDPAF